VGIEQKHKASVDLPTQLKRKRQKGVEATEYIDKFEDRAAVKINRFGQN
jgi:hypothetical protein